MSMSCVLFVTITTKASSMKCHDNAHRPSVEGSPERKWVSAAERNRQLGLIIRLNLMINF